MTSKSIFDQLLAIIPDGRLISVNVGLYWTAVVVEVNGETRCGLAATMGDDKVRCAYPAHGANHAAFIRFIRLWSEHHFWCGGG